MVGKAGFRYDTIISGAGASVGVEIGSGRVVPLGDELARQAWHRLVRGVGTAEPDLHHEILTGFEDAAFRSGYKDNANESEERFKDLYGVRLEYLMQVIFDAVDTALLREAGANEGGVEASTASRAEDWASAFYYSALAGGVPAKRHFYLCELGASQLTLNMDLLLEAAGAQNVVHLHGTYRDPHSIRTTAKHYLSGLNASILPSLDAALRGKNVLVAGYSGRDRDVTPYLLRCNPSRITWLHHSRERGPSFEVGRLAARCRAAGIEFQLEVSSIEKWAEKAGLHIGTGELVARQADAERRLREPYFSKPSMRDVPLSATTRVLAIYQTVTSLGYARLAASYLDAIRAQHPSLNQGILRKALARNASAQNHNARALRILLAEPIVNGDLRQQVGRRSYAGNLNEGAAMLRRATGGSYLDPLLRALTNPGRRPDALKTHVAVCQRIAHTQAMAGNVGRALGMLMPLEALIDGDLDPQIRVNAYAFYSDYLRAAGHYEKAAQINDEAVLDAPYAQLRTRAYALLFAAHIALSRGDHSKANEILRVAEDLAGLGQTQLTASNRALLGWLSILHSNVHMRAQAPERAQAALAVALSLAANEWDHRLGQPLARLHQAALHRTQDQPRRCASCRFAQAS